MTSTNDHLFSQKEVLNCLKTALLKTTHTLPYKKIEDFKLRDFEHLEKALISYFRTIPEFDINVPAAGALYNLALKGESKRSKAMAAVAFYILHQENAFNEDELKQLKSNYGESLFSNYTNRLIILNRYRKSIDAQKRKFISKKVLVSKIKESKYGLSIATAAGIVFLMLLSFLYISKSEPSWKLYSRKSETDNLLNLWVSYDLSPRKAKNAFLKFSDNNKRKIDNPKDSVSFKIPYFHINKVDLFIDDTKFTKSIINPSNGWKARINSVFINDPLIPEMGKVILNDSLKKNWENEIKGEFFRVENFDIPLDEIHFQTKILNTSDTNNCSRNISIELNGFNGSEITELKFTLVPKGCETYAQLKVGEIQLNHSNHNLKNLEIKDEHWKDIQVKTNNKILEIYYDKKRIAQVPYSQNLGLLKAILFHFENSIALDYFRMFDSSGKIILDDNF